MKNLERFNKLDKNAARGEMIEICSALTWVEGMVQKRPMVSLDDLLLKAEKTWNELSKRDKTEAMEDDHSQWPGMKNSALKKELNSLRSTYKEKFKHPVSLFYQGLIFEQVKEYIEESLKNSPEVEWARSEKENMKHIRLRLEKWALTGKVRS